MEKNNQLIIARLEKQKALLKEKIVSITKKINAVKVGYKNNQAKTHDSCIYKGVLLEGCSCKDNGMAIYKCDYVLEGVKIGKAYSRNCGKDKCKFFTEK